MWRLFSLLLALCIAAPASAHTRSQSSSHWKIEGDAVRGRIEADALDATRLYALGGEASLAEMFHRHAGGAFTIRTQAGACAPAAPPALAPAATGRVAAALAFQCPGGSLESGSVTIQSQMFLQVAPSHLHFASLTDSAGAEAEAILTDGRRKATLTPEGAGDRGSALAALARFIPIGAAHVWGGLDHLAFILALALLARRPVTIAIAATGFTLGHTATLVLAALGVLRPDGATVEAMIGFTVAFVAIEAARDGQARMSRWSAPIAASLLAMAAGSLALEWPVAPLALAGLAVFAFAYPRGFRRGAAAAPWLAAAFGLVHGCGFAGALSELDLPRPHLLSALAGFNIGVELAQISVIVFAVSSAAAARRLLGHARVGAAGDAIAAGLFGIGLFWFAGRTLGL